VTNHVEYGEPSADGLWLRRAGLFHEIVGYREAVDLLNDPRFHACFVKIFEGIGISSGPLWEAAQASLLSTNGDEHRRIRAVVAGEFTPRAVERVRAFAARAAHVLGADIDPSRDCEFVSAFAEPYVTATTCQFVGFSEQDVDALWHAVKSIGYAMKDMANRIGDLDEGLALLDYARSALAARRAHPAADVLTVIAKAVDDGSLPEPAALVMVTTLLSAGLEPTVNQLGITVYELAVRPDLWTALAAGEVTPANAVDAILRLRSTNQGATRQVAEPLDYQDVHFKQNETVIVNVAAANHDRRQFADPEALTLDGDRVPHLAFGFGAHYCLGAALARVQLQEAVAALSKLSCPTVVAIREHEGGGLAGPASLVLSFR
jgi:cytochrome P450